MIKYTTIFLYWLLLQIMDRCFKKFRSPLYFVELVKYWRNMERHNNLKSLKSLQTVNE